MSPQSPLKQIKSLDYTVIFARNMEKMKDFYSNIMLFPIVRELGKSWIEFQIGANTLVLTPAPAGGMFNEKTPEPGTASLQLAFRVPPKAVDECAKALKETNTPILAEPKDQQWGHRTLFFKDPDNNILEIYAEI